MKKEYIINKCKKCWNIQIITDQTVCFYLKKPHKEHTSKVKLKSLIKRKKINIENNKCEFFETINSCHRCKYQNYENGCSDKCVLLCEIHPEKKTVHPENILFKSADEMVKVMANRKWHECTCKDFIEGEGRTTPTEEIERNKWKWLNANYYGYS